MAQHSKLGSILPFECCTIMIPTKVGVKYSKFPEMDYSTKCSWQFGSISPRYLMVKLFGPQQPPALLEIPRILYEVCIYIFQWSALIIIKFSISTSNIQATLKNQYMIDFRYGYHSLTV